MVLDNNAGADAVADAVVTFNDDATQTATVVVDGFSEAPELNWELSADGALELTYPGGRKQRLVIRTVLDREYGIWSELDVGSDVYVDYRRTAAVDSTFAMTEVSLQTPAGLYWQSTFNIGDFPIARNFDVPTARRFGYRFEGSNVIRLGARSDNGEFVTEIDVYRLTFGDQGAVLEWQSSADDPGGADCPGVVSCISRRKIDWTPVKFDDGWLYVLERDRRALFFSPWFTWDPVDQRWEDADGVPFDDSQYSWTTPGRLNAYFISDVALRGD